jgi:phospholipase C
MAVEHVVVLCLENRSFDHLLGFLDHPDRTFKGLLRGGPYANPYQKTMIPPTADAKRVLPFGPDHSHDAVMGQLAMSGPPWNRQPTNQGFVTSYELKASGQAPSMYAGALASSLQWLQARRRKRTATARGRGPLVMSCQSPARVPVLSTLALEFAVCDQWFSSVPGETWPNRNYLHAATSDGEVNIVTRPYTDRTIFELIEEHGADWRIYHDDVPQVWAFQKLWDSPARHGNWFPMKRFAEHVEAGNLRAYTFIEPNHRPPVHTLDKIQAFGGHPGSSNSQHPENNQVADDAYESFDPGIDTDFARAERLIASVYETLRANAELFATTMLVITYDEHGGFFDHVPPTHRVAGQGPARKRSRVARIQHALWHRRAEAFDFTRLGVRVPTVVISPLVPRGVVDHTIYEHSSVPATLRALFAPDAGPLNERAEQAATFHRLASLSTPRTDLPDLSALREEPAAPTPPAATQPVEPDAGLSKDAAGPEYYQDFLAQAEVVREHLIEVTEPEATNLTPIVSAHDGAAVATAFDDAAHRHRHAPASPSAGP